MLTHSDLKKGARIILDEDPYEILEAAPLKKAQRRVVVQSKVKNLLNGKVFDRNFHQGETFEEADLLKFEAKFLYTHKDRYFFCDVKDPSKRFDLSAAQIGYSSCFLKPNQIVEAIIFNDKVINISLPIKVYLEVIEAPPGIKGDRAQGGTKIATLETGAKINVPLFIKKGNIVEVNTTTGEYVRRVEQKNEKIKTSLKS